MHGNFNASTLQCHCVKSVRIRSYSSSQFHLFGLNLERYSVSLCSQSECGKMRTRITPNADTFYAVCCAISKIIIAFLVGKNFCQYFRCHVNFYFASVCKLRRCIAADLSFFKITEKLYEKSLFIKVSAFLMQSDNAIIECSSVVY